MKTYLVGGAVRDQLLGRKRPADRDWVVVGATADDLLAQGFRQVGRDFPVFLHPESGEHHALARTERKTGHGHVRFVCHADPDVTLEDDLRRRDLTINAMARDGDGRLIDPFGGEADIAARRLRHVSPAFAEDPLRVFRVARFAAQLPDFRIADETLALMQAMRPELPALSGERVWQEFVKAAPDLGRFFGVVRKLDGGHWFDALDLPATVALFERRAASSRDAALTMPGWVHEAQVIGRTYSRLCAPRLLQRAVRAVASHGRTLAGTGSATALLNALGALDAFRQGRLTALVLEAVGCCTDADTPALHALIAELKALRVDGASGPDYGKALAAKRLATIERWRGAFSRPAPT